MPVFQCPGYRPLSDKERKMLSGGGCTILPLPEEKKTPSNGGCGTIPEELKNLLNGPIILTVDGEADDKVNKIFEDTSYNGKSNESTKIYSKPKGYADAIKDFDSMQLDSIKSIKNGEGFVGVLPDGRQVNVRKTSKGNYKGENKWPTLEIRSVDGKRSKFKIRYTKENACP